VADHVGPSPGLAPDPALEFHPLRTGFLRLDALRLVDNFGLARDVTIGRVVRPATFPEVQGDDHAFLPPRLLCPARLRFRWVDAAATGAGETVDHPSSSPVHGWLVFSQADERILVFDGAGVRVGSIELVDDQTVWTDVG